MRCAIRATRFVPTWRPTCAKIELSDLAVACASVADPLYAFWKLCTTKTSCLPWTVKLNVLGPEVHTDNGLIPFWRAVARMKGLIADPGWRWPLVARLKGRRMKSFPPTIARTSPVWLSITTAEAVGPTPARRPWIACCAACWKAGSIVVFTFKPPPNAAPAP